MLATVHLSFDTLIVSAKISLNSYHKMKIRIDGMIQVTNSGGKSFFCSLPRPYLRLVFADLMSFDELSSTSEKLSHPTVSRPKMPSRRLPTQFGGGQSVSTCCTSLATLSDLESTVFLLHLLIWLKYLPLKRVKFNRERNFVPVEKISTLSETQRWWNDPMGFPSVLCASFPPAGLLSSSFLPPTAVIASTRTRIFNFCLFAHARCRLNAREMPASL